jgi:hypothetical protein
MTSNIDKLNLIAPLLAGRELELSYIDDTGWICAIGMFHSLEIDDVYPGSEPKAYFRATNVVHERRDGFPVYEAVLVSRREEDYDEFVFPVDDLLGIELVQSNLYEKKDLVTISFAPEGEEGRGYSLFFSPGTKG